MASRKGGGSGGALAGIFSVLGVVLVIGLRVYRAEMRAQSREKNEQRAVDLERDCRAHAHALMDLAPDVERVGEYLHWGVRTYHAQAWERVGSSFGTPASAAYRDALFDLIIARAAKDGRESETRSLEKLRVRSRAAGETWWEIRKM